MYEIKKVQKGQILMTVELNDRQAVVEAPRNGWIIVDENGKYDLNNFFPMKEAATKQCEWMNRRAA